jgi:hypothetical protein
MQKFGMSMVAGMVSALVFGVVACDDGAIDKSENAIRCRDMCDDVGQCLDWSDSKEESCRSECKENSVDDDFENKVEDCQQCLDDDKSCASNAIDCASECTGVVVISGK